MLVFSAHGDFSHAFILCTKHKHSYIHMHIYYSNDLDIHKIQVMQDLQEWNDCVSRGASVYYFDP
jgi:hypothetical protein